MPSARLALVPLTSQIRPFHRVQTLSSLIVLKLTEGRLHRRSHYGVPVPVLPAASVTDVTVTLPSLRPE